MPYELLISLKHLVVMPVAKFPEHIVNTSLTFLSIVLYKGKLTRVFGTKLA